MVARKNGGADCDKLLSLNEQIGVKLPVECFYSQRDCVCPLAKFERPSQTYFLLITSKWAACYIRASRQS